MRAAPDLVAAHEPHPQPERHVLRHNQVREQQWLQENHTDRAPLRGHCEEGRIAKRMPPAQFARSLGAPPHRCRLAVVAGWPRFADRRCPRRASHAGATSAASMKECMTKVTGRTRWASKGALGPKTAVDKPSAPTPAWRYPAGRAPPRSSSRPPSASPRAWSTLAPIRRSHRSPFRGAARSHRCATSGGAGSRRTSLRGGRRAPADRPGGSGRTYSSAPTTTAAPGSAQPGCRAQLRARRRGRDTRTSGWPSHALVSEANRGHGDRLEVRSYVGRVMM